MWPVATILVSKGIESQIRFSGLLKKPTKQPTNHPNTKQASLPNWWLSQLPFRNALNGANIYPTPCSMVGLVYTDFYFGDLENFRFWEEFFLVAKLKGSLTCQLIHSLSSGEIKPQHSTLRMVCLIFKDSPEGVSLVTLAIPGNLE